MTSYKRVFTIKNPHGPGGVFFAWQRTSGGFLATTGYDQAIHIYNRSDWQRLRKTFRTLSKRPFFPFSTSVVNWNPSDVNEIVFH